MSTALATIPDATAIEQALAAGNLASLTPIQRVNYYKAVCDSVGLNPLTKPFEYITLNGKLTLYACKVCTDQIRKRDAVSIKITAREMVDGVYVVTASANDASGRTDESVGAVPIGNLQGEARANAMMKAETKAKRRVTLSFSGLGMLDESEVDGIPAARTYTTEEAHGEAVTDLKQLPGIKTGADIARKPLTGETELLAAKTLPELAAAWQKCRWRNGTDEEQFLTDLAKRRKAEILAASEGEQSRPPSVSSATGPDAAESATTGAASATVPPHATADVGVNQLPQRPARGPTAKSLSDLLTAVADITGDDETHIIGELCRTVDAPDLDSMDAAQRGGADAWLRQRAKKLSSAA